MLLQWLDSYKLVQHHLAIEFISVLIEVQTITHHDATANTARTNLKKVNLKGLLFSAYGDNFKVMDMIIQHSAAFC